MNKCFNQRVYDSRFPLVSRPSQVSQKGGDVYLPETDARLFDSPRAIALYLDTPPYSGYIPEKDRYCHIPNTPRLGYKSREENASSWQYYISENQSKPFNPSVYGNDYVATLQDFQDPMSSQKTEMHLNPIKSCKNNFGLNDVQDSQLHRLDIMSKLQSKMDEQKFGPKYVVKNRPLTCQSWF